MCRRRRRWAPDAKQLADARSRVSLPPAMSMTRRDICDAHRFCLRRSRARHLERTGWRRSAGGAAEVRFISGPRAAQLAAFLPDGRRFLYLMRRADGSGHLMLAGRCRTARGAADAVQRRVRRAGLPGLCGGRRAARAAIRRTDGTVSGDPFSVADQVFYFFTTSVAGVRGVATAGTLVYSAHDDEQRLMSVRSNGRSLGTIGEPRPVRKSRCEFRLTVAACCSAVRRQVSSAELGCRSVAGSLFARRSLHGFYVQRIRELRGLRIAVSVNRPTVAGVDRGRLLRAMEPRRA